MRDKVYNACLGVPECKQALFKPPLSAEALEADIRTAIYNEEKEVNSSFVMESSTNDQNAQNYLERRFESTRGNRGNRGGYGHRGGSRGRSNFRGNFRGSRARRPYFGGRDRQKKCFVCGKDGCWSTIHSDEERRESFDRFKNQRYFKESGHLPTMTDYQAFLVDWEGVKGFDDSIDDVDQYLYANWDVDAEAGPDSDEEEWEQLDS
ncbi:hypothetical protein K3495_g13370 [Podosphaera aphanis]|nr:hypothetical protein K3495_g13370 [Podosphaera aphanis]